MLKQETEERSLPIWHTPTQTTQETKPAAGRASISRADAEDILQRAARLQSDEQERISVSELEALAVERGISPRFVRQAMGSHTRTQPQYVQAMPLPRIRLTQRQWQVAAAVVVLFWLVTALSTTSLTFFSPLLNSFPLLIVAALGYYLRYKRAGAAAGLAFMFANVLGQIVMAGLRGTSFPYILNYLIPSLSVYALLYWLTAGVAGAALRQWMTTRQSPFEPTVFTASDLDR